MSNVKMPKPIAYIQDNGHLMNFTSHPERHTGLITTDQAEAYARAVRDEALDEAILLIESIEFPVGNSAAGELAADWALKTLSEARHAIRGLKEQQK